MQEQEKRVGPFSTMWHIMTLKKERTRAARFSAPAEGDAGLWACTWWKWDDRLFLKLDALHALGDLVDLLWRRGKRGCETTVAATWRQGRKEKTPREKKRSSQQGPSHLGLDRLREGLTTSAIAKRRGVRRVSNGTGSIARNETTPGMKRAYLGAAKDGGVSVSRQSDGLLLCAGLQLEARAAGGRLCKGEWRREEEREQLGVRSSEADSTFILHSATPDFPTPPPPPPHGAPAEASLNSGSDEGGGPLTRGPRDCGWPPPAPRPP